MVAGIAAAGNRGETPFAERPASAKSLSRVLRAKLRGVIRRLTIVALLGIAVCAAQSKAADQPAPDKTLFVECSQPPKAQRVVSPISLAEAGGWRAYVEVDIHDGCLHTTRLWASRENQPWRLLFMIPPTREEDSNGMQILGWAHNSQMLLAKTQRWQSGTDGGAREQILAIDAGTGLVYDPDLDRLRENHKNQQCGYRITDAGFTSNPNVQIRRSHTLVHVCR